CEPRLYSGGAQGFMDGPTPVLEKTIDLSHYRARTGVQTHFLRVLRLQLLFSTRQGDGYVVAKIMEPSAGLLGNSIQVFRIELYMLSRDPIISEMAPKNSTLH
ncbi:hypothetical protein BX616_009091, partial [Lobosporangium transversale]